MYYCLLHSPYFDRDSAMSMPRFSPIQIYICIFSIQIDICMSAGGHFVSLVVKFDDISGNSAKEDFPLICFLSFDLESHFDSYKLHWSFCENLNNPVLEIIFQG